MELLFKKCELQHLDALIAISKKTFIQAFEAMNNPVDFQSYLNRAYNRNEMKMQLETQNSTFYFVFLEGLKVGYIKINEKEAQKESFDMQAIELERIYVLSEFQGQKIGEKILKKVIAYANEKKASYLWLGVWERNDSAIRFYQRHGFKKFGQHPYIIGEDEQYDWLMKREIS